MLRIATKILIMSRFAVAGSDVERVMARVAAMERAARASSEGGQVLGMIDEFRRSADARGYQDARRAVDDLRRKTPLWRMGLEGYMEMLGDREARVRDELGKIGVALGTYLGEGNTVLTPEICGIMLGDIEGLNGQTHAARSSIREFVAAAGHLRAMRELEGLTVKLRKMRRRIVRLFGVLDRECFGLLDIGADIGVAAATAEERRLVDLAGCGGAIAGAVLF